VLFGVCTWRSVDIAQFAAKANKKSTTPEKKKPLQKIVGLMHGEVQHAESIFLWPLMLYAIQPEDFPPMPLQEPVVVSDTTAPAKKA